MNTHRRNTGNLMKRFWATLLLNQALVLALTATMMDFGVTALRFGALAIATNAVLWSQIRRGKWNVPENKRVLHWAVSLMWIAFLALCVLLGA